ncbi:GIY-YIG nuclease family protein [Methylobacterium sp. AMS5]|uniref:GIY-YIG nuclease family protein n=1 Tax=Methylobacterium sp. AMS5 TaxID=925818 RepID=UPI000B219FC0|nr:GIY-YIG nuclease family protein [Methylobacterium sp. AMS5]
MTPRPSARRGRTLKLYLVDGSPSGVITAELGISSVRAAVASRTALPDLVKREEAGRTGVYLLVGLDPDLPGRQLVYVGESDQVRARLAVHDADDSKDFFTRACIVVSKDENLTKAHGRYLESRLIAAIRSAGRAKLVNGTEPEFRGLPEPEIADMERVLDEIEVLLPVLGFDVLRPAGHEAGAPAAAAAEGIGAAGSSYAPAAPTFVAEFKRAKARAVERGGEFVVLAGSTALRRETPGIPKRVQDQRRALSEAGTLAEDSDPDLYRFTADASFNSPSGASCVIAGRSDNGPLSWLVESDRRSYAAWRASQLATTERAGA